MDTTEPTPTRSYAREITELLRLQRKVELLAAVEAVEAQR